MAIPWIIRKFNTEWRYEAKPNQISNNETQKGLNLVYLHKCRCPRTAVGTSLWRTAGRSWNKSAGTSRDKSAGTSRWPSRTWPARRSVLPRWWSSATRLKSRPATSQRATYCHCLVLNRVNLIKFFPLLPFYKHKFYNLHQVMILSYANNKFWHCNYFYLSNVWSPLSWRFFVFIH